ncbi:MAG: amidohydrolase family protein, partial [Planctomycetes bacterium]|nr:amidohydrolase family protein [Planctomycetota bacterium]
DTISIGDGRSVRQGIVLIQAGRITAVGADMDLPANAEVLEIKGGHLTPGLIDANARIESIDMIDASRRWSRSEDVLESENTSNRRDDDAGDTQVGCGCDDPEYMRDGHVGEDGEEGDDFTPFSSGVAARGVVTEQSSEVVPYIRVLDALEFGSRDFDRLVRGGVTTVYASPDASAVIGARGAVVHTGGPSADRVLIPTAAVKATIGADPGSLGTYNRPPSRHSSNLYNRRPNSRMGLVWVFRKSFYDALRQRDGLPIHGADTAEPEALDVLLGVLEGRVPLRIQARLQRDILTALRLADEFNLPFTLEEATEAYRCLDEIKSAGVPVIFGPIYDRPAGIRRSSGEGRESRYYTFRALLEKGIPTALSAQEFRDDDGLARQAMYAQRFGVSFDDSLRAVTLTPARLLGLEDQLGTVEVGKRADLILWSGQPLAAASTPSLVLIDGQIVLDRR